MYGRTTVDLAVPSMRIRSVGGSVLPSGACRGAGTAGCATLSPPCLSGPLPVRPVVEPVCTITFPPCCERGSFTAIEAEC
jgi:hypothetical protein